MWCLYAFSTPTQNATPYSAAPRLAWRAKSSSLLLLLKNVKVFEELHVGILKCFYKKCYVLCFVYKGRKEENTNIPTDKIYNNIRGFFVCSRLQKHWGAYFHRMHMHTIKAMYWDLTQNLPRYKLVCNMWSTIICKYSIQLFRFWRILIPQCKRIQ